MSHLAVLCFSLVLFAVHAQATTRLYKSFNDLVTESQGIVQGTVRSVEVAYDEQGKNIYTFVTFDQLHIIHGRYDQNEFVIRLEGGQVGEAIYALVGSPEFAPEERVILFLRGNGESMVPLVGWTQGVFQVAYDDATGQDVLLDYDGNRVLGLNGEHLETEAEVPQEAMPVQGFIETIQQHLEAQTKESVPIQTVPVGHFPPAVEPQEAAPQEVPKAPKSIRPQGARQVPIPQGSPSLPAQHRRSVQGAPNPTAPPTLRPTPERQTSVTIHAAPLLIGVTAALGLVALGLGVVVLPPAPSRPSRRP
jgi:hypothetical protein